MSVGTRPLVSPKFLHVSLGVGGWPLGYEERRCWANCSCSYFPSFSTYVDMIRQCHRRTDRQTDRQTTCDSNTALCTIVHHAVKRHSKLDGRWNLSVTKWSNYKNKLCISNHNDTEATIKSADDCADKAEKLHDLIYPVGHKNVPLYFGA